MSEPTRDQLLDILASLSARATALCEERAWYGSALGTRKLTEGDLALQSLNRVYEGTFAQLERTNL